jgi:hypothetical protein
MPSGSNSNGRARIVIAFIFLFVSTMVLSVGAYLVAHFDKFRDDNAAREGQTALQGITDPKQTDEALRRRPSPNFLQLTEMATKAASETRAAAEKLSREIEPPGLSNIALNAADRSELEAIRGALKSAELNATTFLPRYVALFKTEHARIENYAISLHLENNTVRRFIDSVDKRHSQTIAFTSRMLSGRADYYRAYENYVAVLAGEFGLYTVKDGQFLFPFQRTVDRYNVAANGLTAAAKRVAELEEEGKALTRSQHEEWEQYVNSK